MTKAMGFNGARKHQKVEDPRFLYWADKMGLLVSGEMANALPVRRGVRAALHARVASRRSNATTTTRRSSCGCRSTRAGARRSCATRAQQAHLKAMYTLTKSLDATRLVIDNDGWEHTDTTDLFAHPRLRAHRRPAGDEVQRSSATPRRAFRDNGRAALVPGYEYNGTPIFLLTEFGGIAYHRPGRQRPKSAWGYSGVEKTPRPRSTRLRGLYEAIAKVPRFVGVLLHAADRRRAGDQRPADVRPQAEVRSQSSA